MVHDIRTLLDEPEDEAPDGKDAVYLWDDKSGSVPPGVSYGKEGDDI